jgi:hypothetical protein
MLVCQCMHVIWWCRRAQRGVTLKSSKEVFPATLSVWQGTQKDAQRSQQNCCTHVLGVCIHQVCNQAGRVSVFDRPCLTV